MSDITNQQLLEAMTESIQNIADNMVTKKDLDERLKAFATREELDERLKSFATKDDLKLAETSLQAKITGVETSLQAKITLAETRLERKLASASAANVKHHLETRKMIGDLSRSHDALREGLAQAVIASR
jgi:hypothetical protein